MRTLILYSRRGCCLCEGLAQRLDQLDLAALRLQLEVIDIDGPEVPKPLHARYDLEVPVLVVEGRELPRVSPRLAGQGLQRWLQRCVDGLAAPS